MNICPLTENHDVISFECGEDQVDYHIKHYSLLNSNQSREITYVAHEVDNVIKGFVTLAMGRIDFDCRPPDMDSKNYHLPVVWIACVGVHVDSHKEGIGSILMTHAFSCAVKAAEQVGCWGIEIKTLDQTKMPYFQRFGFASLRDSETHMFLPMHLVRQYVSAAT